MKDHDDILETAAQLVEKPSLLDIAGMLTRTKKAKREYDLRSEATQKERARCAGLIRAMISGRDLDPVTTLRRISELEPGSRQQNLYLVKAWPLAWKGWLKIECRINCAGNSCPPETAYSITLTDEGRAVLAHG